MNFCQKALVFLSLSLCPLSHVFAQGVVAKEIDIFEKSLDDLSLMATMGAAGGVIGLSTLSFVEDPWDRLQNIVTGAAIGIIVGVGWLGYEQVIKSYDDMSAESFHSFDRMSWKTASTLSHGDPFYGASAKRGPSVGWVWQF